MDSSLLHYMSAARLALLARDFRVDTGHAFTSLVREVGLVVDGAMHREKSQHVLLQEVFPAPFEVERSVVAD